eukprot:3854454-Prymnesium_polylepis.1
MNVYVNAFTDKRAVWISIEITDVCDTRSAVHCCDFADFAPGKAAGVRGEITDWRDQTDFSDFDPTRNHPKSLNFGAEIAAGSTAVQQQQLLLHQFLRH